jgi:hypothetical protein
MESRLSSIVLTALIVVAGSLPTWAQSAEQRVEGKNLGRPALVFLVAGQSNANGCGVLSPEIHAEDGLAQKRPLIPGTTASEIGLPIDADAYSHSHIWAPDEKAFQAVDPTRNLFPPKLDERGHGMELPVVRELEKRFPETDIFVIKYARGGSNLFRHWNPENTHPEQGFYAKWLECYREGMARLKERYPEVRVIGLYWDQGESDGKNAADQYEENLTRFIEVVRRDTGIPRLPFFIRKHLFRWPNIDTIIAAQLEIASKDPRCHIIDIDLGTLDENYKAWAYSPDNGHLSSKGFVALTRQLFEGPLKGASMKSFEVLPQKFHEKLSP